MRVLTVIQNGRPKKKSEGSAQKKACIWGIISLTIFLCFWGIGLFLYQNHLSQLLRHDVQFTANVYKNQLINRIDRRVARLDALESFIIAHQNLSSSEFEKEFQNYAMGILAGKIGIRSVIISPQGINRFVYPIQGNEVALNHNLFLDNRPEVRRDVAKTIKTQEVVISGPYELRQGGMGFVARKAVFIQNKFWGFSILVLDLSPLLEEAGINSGMQILNLSLRKKDGAVFSGDSTLFNKESIQIPIPVNGNQWEMAAAPVDGWDKPLRSNLRIGNFLFLLLTCLGTVFAYLLSLKHYSLQDEVNWQTRELRTKNQEFQVQLTRASELEEKLKQEEAKYRELTESIDDIFFAMDSDFKYTYWNRASEKITGIKACDAIGKSLYEVFPETRDSSVDEFYKNVLKNGKSGYWVNSFNFHGKERYFEIHAYPSEHGISIFSRDISDKIKTTQTLEHLTSFLDSDPSPILELDESGEIKYCNRSARETLEWLKAGGDLKQYFPENIQEILEWLKEGREGIVYNEIPIRKAVFGASILISPQHHSIRIYLSDISSLKNNEKRLQQSHRTLQVLSQANEALIRAVSESSFLKEVCRILVEKGGYSLAWVGYLEEGAEGKVVPVEFFGENKEYVDQMNIVLSDPIRGSGPAGRALKSHKSVIARDLNNDATFTPWLEFAHQLGIQLTASFPFRLSGNQWGALNLYSRDEGSFNEVEQTLLQQLVDDMSFGIQNLRVRMDRDRKEEELSHKQEEMKTIIQSSPMAIIAVDLAGKVLLWNKMAEEMLGWTTEEILGKNMSIIPSGKEEEYLHFRKTAFKGESIRNFETQWNHKNGTPIDISISLAPIFTAYHEIKGMMAVIDDITEDKRMKAALEESQLLLDTAVKASNTGLWSWDFTSEQMQLSPECSEILGYQNHSFVASLTQWKRLIHHEDLHRVLKYVQSYVKNPEGPYSIEYRIKHNDGSYRWVISRASILMDENNRPQRLVGSQIDITEVKQREEEIRRLNETLEERVKLRTAQLLEANKELESFSYSVSHDLRVPLRAIDGFSRIVLEEYGSKLDEEGKRLLHVVRDNSRKMGNLIDDLLAFSRLGRKEMTRSTVDMNQLVKAVIEDLTMMMDKNRLEIILKPLPPSTSDPSMIKQVYQNLISNALKFSSKEQKSQVEAGVLTINQETVYYVKDNGVGFDMHYVDKLFGVFQRLHSPEEFEGTGVGLALVHRIISRHGGKIWAESKLGEGACFYFTLPDKGEVS